MSDDLQRDENEALKYQLAKLRLCVARIAQAAKFHNPYLDEFLMVEDKLHQACHDYTDGSNSRWISCCLQIRLFVEALEREEKNNAKRDN
jgi:hypothetical protein